MKKGLELVTVTLPALSLIKGGLVTFLVVRETSQNTEEKKESEDSTRNVECYHWASGHTHTHREQITDVHSSVCILCFSYASVCFDPFFNDFVVEVAPRRPPQSCYPPHCPRPSVCLSLFFLFFFLSALLFQTFFLFEWSKVHSRSLEDEIMVRQLGDRINLTHVSCLPLRFTPITPLTWRCLNHFLYSRIKSPLS